MLLCETAGSAVPDLEDLAVFASQLAAAGVEARVPAASAAGGLHRNLRFELAPHLADGPAGPGDTLVVLAAHRLTDERMMALRRLAEGPVRAVAVGAFASRQAVIGTRARLSYALNRDPEMVELEGPDALAGLPVFGVDVRGRREGGGAAGPPWLLLVSPDLAEPGEARALQALALDEGARLAVLTDRDAKEAWVAAHGHGVPFFHFGEVLPAGLARRADVCAVFAEAPASYRVQCLLADVVAGGGVVLDGTPGHALAAAEDAPVPAPPGVATLSPFLAQRILPNLARLSAQSRSSRTAARTAAGELLGRLGLDAPPPPSPPPAPAPPGRGPERQQAPRRVVFMPTNGIGLGHAQRCSVIAGALKAGALKAGALRAGALKADALGTEAAPVFAAFPSCMALVKSRGFDVMPLVGRSARHREPYENDLPNYLRLRALAAAGRAGVLVFDGGYVFDSVFRTLLETGLPGVWIRRGLWQAAQDNRLALDREKAFARVIVPGEAFDELNRPYSRGAGLRAVGPVVAAPPVEAEAREALRRALAERFGRPFRRLLVSLLGAGVAADRSAQVQTLAGLAERRDDTLHLVVAWPAATLRPAWFGWRSTRVVRTLRAGTLAAAADLLVSAAGYNSFLDVLYGRMPAIFVPQTGPFMDDQRSRARAAAGRGLAALVEPGDLVALDRRAARLLDGEAEDLRARLAAEPLPEPGNAEAARLIEELLP